MAGSFNTIFVGMIVGLIDFVVITLSGWGLIPAVISVPAGIFLSALALSLVIGGILSFIPGFS